MIAGIFEWVDGDTARICVPANPGGNRPTKFTAGIGSKQALWVYQRVKK